jgi:hypothetical protein
VPAIVTNAIKRWPSLAKLTAKHHNGVYVYRLAILSRHRCGHCRDSPVRAHKAANFPRLSVRDMDFLRSVTLSKLQNIVQEEPTELVAFALNDLPQMRTRSYRALMVDL